MGQRERASEPPDRDEFASQMLEALRQAGETAELRYDAESFCLRSAAEGPYIFNLDNAYNEYRAAEGNKRPAVIKAFVRAWFSRHKDVPDELEDARHDLLPAVRPRSFFELTRLRTRLEGLDPPDWPYRPLAEHLGIGLVYDLPESILQIQEHHLAAWEASFEPVLEIALENLAQISHDDYKPIGRGVLASPWHDNHDAARLLLIQKARACDLAGDPVAIVPNRDMLLLTGSEDEAGLVRLAARAAKGLEHPRPLSGIAVRLDGDSWVPFLPEPGHPARPAFRKLAVWALGQAYGEQNELLVALNQKNNHDIFVASLGAFERKEDGEVFSYCVWTEGVPSLLPQTDLVILARPRGENDVSLLARAPWDDLQRVAGELLEPLDLYPMRYRARDFPSAEQIAALPKDD